jgi:ATP phosphoribosyltransferase
MNGNLIVDIVDEAKTLIENGAAEFSLIANFADKFVVWAREFMKDSKGSEKMEEVVKQLEQIAEKYNITMTEDQLKAIAQTAYENMIGTTKSAEEVANQTIQAIVVEKQTAVDPSVDNIEMLDESTKVIKED